jgi:hypothetical protein
VTIFVCGQNEVMPGECLCGSDYNRLIPGGVVGPHGWRYCGQQCIDDQLDHEARRDANDHLGVRDLLCACPDICAPAGLPTAAMLQEYADYLASIKGTALDPGAGSQRVIE